MRAFVSGQSGVAIFEEGASWYVLKQSGSPEKVPLAGAARLFDGCSDVRQLTNADRDTIEQELSRACAKQFCLQYTLTLLSDSDLQELETRLLSRVEELLADEPVSEFLVNRLYARPLSVELFERAAVLIDCGQTSALAAILTEVLDHQDQIRAFHVVWPAVAERHFQNIRERDEYFLEWLDQGLVRAVASRNTEALTDTPSSSDFHRALIEDWIQSAGCISADEYDRVEVGLQLRSRVEGGDSSTARTQSPSGPSGRPSGPAPQDSLPGFVLRPEHASHLPCRAEVVQALWRSLFAAALLKDNQGRLTACNDAFLRFVKKPESELIGRTPSQYLGPKGRIFERYDAEARECGCPIMTREIFGKRERITARWPLGNTGRYGSLSVYLIPLEDRAQPTNALLSGEFHATAPDPEICVLFLETCPWAIMAFDEEERFVFANQAYRMVFTSPDRPDPGAAYFEGRRVEDLCPRNYWRDNEKRVVHFVDTSANAVESSVRVEHPYLDSAPRDVVRYKIGFIRGRLFRGTIGLDTGYIERLRNAPPIGDRHAAFHIPPNDRR